MTKFKIYRQRYVLDFSINRYNETILLSDPEHMFWLRNKKNDFQIHTLIWRPDSDDKIQNIQPTICSELLKRTVLMRRFF